MCIRDRSGGADSVCLLVILNELKKEFNMELFAVHIHHGLRGSEADRDSRYAQELSESLGVPFVCVHVKAAEYAKEHGMSEEEAGRYLRYHILEQERIRVNGTRIAAVSYTHLFSVLASRDGDDWHYIRCVRPGRDRERDGL